MKEGDNITFATDEEAERTLWIQAIYRATGQSHKPQPPVTLQQQQQQNKPSTNTQLSKMQGGESRTRAGRRRAIRDGGGGDEGRGQEGRGGKWGGRPSDPER